jgi:hypothetical protein
MYNARLANGDSDLENITTVQCEMSGVFRPIDFLADISLLALCSSVNVP